MPVDPNLVRDKAIAMADGILKMTEAERREQPSELFGQHYNQLIRLVENAYPGAGLMLPPLVTFNKHREDKLCEQKFSEILIWTKEIIAYLDHQASKNAQTVYRAQGEFRGSSHRRRA